ncbi:MAG: hypothetical protein Q8R28_03905, partial [Dehalococcoidia bacterium]|nr:hypothetical protein [Dehalococcoidia bacterium]
KRSAAGVWGAVLDAVNDWTGVADAWPPALGVDSSGNSYVVVQKDNHLGDESVYLKQVTAAEGLGALTVFDAVILMPNANPSVYSSLWHGGSQYSLVPASFQPVALLLNESGINADGFFELYGMGSGGGGGGGGGPLLVVSAPTVQTLAATGVT